MNSPQYWFVFGCIVIATICAAGCGHIDEDFDLTDEELAAKYGDTLEGIGGIGLSGSGRVSSGCGGYGYAEYGQGSHGQPGYRTSYPYELGATTLVGSAAQDGQAGSAQSLMVARRREKTEPEEAPAPRPTGRRLSTWGEYLAQEMERAERIDAP